MKDYYAQLGLSKDCSFNDISNAFRKLALKRRDLPSLHQIAEAYDVLSSPDLRKNYDQFGEFVFKQGLTLESSSFPGYTFKNNTQEIFLKFFGTTHPYFNENTIKSSENPIKPPNDIIIEVPCSLEELYSGCRKNVEYSNLGNNAHWKELEIPSCCDDGHKFVFYGEGEENEYFPKSNLVFVVKEAKHKEFCRDGKNLVYLAKISLLHALSGLPIEIESLDKKKITVSFDKVIAHGSTAVVPGFGFSSKGNLIVKVEVEFPKYVDIGSKQKLVELLT